MEHRSSTKTCHLNLLCAVLFASFHVRCFLSSSAILVHRQVCWSLPLFCFPCGFHSSALLATCPSGLLNTWPIYPQALCLISCSIGRCPVCLQSSLLLIFLGHQIRKMSLKLLLTNTCSFCSKLLVSLQVSEPYKSTVFTFGPKTLSLVLVVNAVDRHIGLNIANACLAFQICAWMSLSVPPFLHVLTMLPRYVNSSTSSIRPSTTDTPSSRLVPIRISFVLVALIFRPTFAPCTSKACVLSLISCIPCNSRASLFHAPGQ